MVASIGGNNKTKHVLELSLIPTSIIQDWSSLTEGIKPLLQGTMFVHALRDRGLIRAICPDSCTYVQAGTGCYVNHNPRNAAQVARIIRNVDTMPEPGLYLDALQEIAKLARLLGLQKVRSMITGDGALVPVAVWQPIETLLLAKYPADAWLGYTHDPIAAPHLKLTHVASCDTREQAINALANGWSVFEVGDPTAQSMPVGASLCPASKEFANFRGFKMDCGGCPMACNGARQKHNYIPRHSAGDSSRKAASARRGNNTLTDSKGRTRGLMVAA